MKFCFDFIFLILHISGFVSIINACRFSPSSDLFLLLPQYIVQYIQDTTHDTQSTTDDVCIIFLYI